MKSFEGEVTLSHSLKTLCIETFEFAVPWRTPNGSYRLEIE